MRTNYIREELRNLKGEIMPRSNEFTLQTHRLSVEQSRNVIISYISWMIKCKVPTITKIELNEITQAVKFSVCTACITNIQNISLYKF